MRHFFVSSFVVREYWGDEDGPDPHGGDCGIVWCLHQDATAEGDDYHSIIVVATMKKTRRNDVFMIRVGEYDIEAGGEARLFER